jgi:hypothetical protein
MKVEIREGRKLMKTSFLILLLFVFGIIFAPQIGAQQSFQQSSYNPQPNTNYLRSSQAFRHEIARFEITVHREGRLPLSLSQVPRVEKGDLIKVRLLDEAINGIKLDQSLYNWTLLVAFINPNRKFSASGQGPVVSGQKGENRSAQSSVSEEIDFRKKGWYREHSFTVPYDSQPVFFLYPRPGYRGKILGLINKNYNEIRKLGEKTIDLAGAYAQIGTFLSELQGVLSGAASYGNNAYYGNAYNSYNNYNPYGYTNYGYTQSYNYNLLVTQSVERLARSFNIQLPQNCWQSGPGYSSGSYGSGNNRNGISPDIVTRLQCVARNIRLEDFDLSVARMLQQGGIFLAAQLQQKYPQIAHWINIAALAVDFIVKVFKKTPMRIVPTVTSSSDNPIKSYGVAGSYQSYQSPSYSPNSVNSVNSGNYNAPMPKISVFAENQPDDSQFVTAYPLILHKWQAEPDAEVISLRPPVLMKPCLQAGVNILKSTDLTDDQLSDNFTKDYVLTLTSTNGFKKAFSLKKNIGLSGWELNITPQDLQEFLKIRMTLEAVISGKRGFNEIKSPPFNLPIAIGENWEITPESEAAFRVGGKRTITFKNTLGNCQCLQAVIYKPSFGGQFVFEADSGATSDNHNGLQYSPDGSEVSLEMNVTDFKPGPGEMELKIFGGETIKLPLKLYPLPPVITHLKIGKGDRAGLIGGTGLEQIQAVKINGRRAVIIGNQPPAGLVTTNRPPQSPLPNTSAGSSSTASLLKDYIPNIQLAGPNERLLIIEDPNTALTENTAALELILEDNRTFQIPQIFSVGPSRPVIVSNRSKEMEGTAVDGEKLTADSSSQKARNGKRLVNTNERKEVSRVSDLNSQLSAKEIFPIATAEITLTVENALTDYDFRVENLSIETRLERMSSSNTIDHQNTAYQSPGDGIPLPKVDLEVLDWKHLRITLQIPEEVRKLLGGRRLQFRIRDRARGDSDWYTIKQTFVRIPEIASITCKTEMNGMCELKGATIDYISQVSIDGGQNWYPQSPAGLQTRPAPDGQKLAMIPLLQNKKLLKVRLRDFPRGNGLFIGNFNSANSVRKSQKDPSITDRPAPTPD